MVVAPFLSRLALAFVVVRVVLEFQPVPTDSAGVHFRRLGGSSNSGNVECPSCCCYYCYEWPI
jgi:hypothetical protein